MSSRDAYFGSFDSPIGHFWLAGGANGLLEVTRTDAPDALLADLARRGRPTIPDGARLAPAMEWLRAYFSGERPGRPPRLDMREVPEFDAAIYRAAMAIPYGATASYGELAVAAGSPRAARAAGGAMARCPLFPFVPCHRVIHADGSIGGWRSELWVKRWLLDHERD
jgi:methylated-DNA-[protein]-cysteine S-methyltransferase